jgi:hypothetical protein
MTPLKPPSSSLRYPRPDDRLLEQKVALPTHENVACDVSGDSVLNSEQRRMFAEGNKNGTANQLRRRAATLDEREVRLAQLERGVTSEALDQKLNDTLSLLRDEAAPTPSNIGRDGEPVVANPTALAAAIVWAGAKRRGEFAGNPALPGGLAGEIVKAGMKRRGELVEEGEPKTEAQCVAAMIVEAGKRRRGEIT